VFRVWRGGVNWAVAVNVFGLQRPDLQIILRHSYDDLTIMPKLRSTYDERLIYKTCYEERKAILRYEPLQIAFVN